MHRMASEWKLGAALCGILAVILLVTFWKEGTSEERVLSEKVTGVFEALSLTKSAYITRTLTHSAQRLAPESTSRTSQSESLVNSAIEQWRVVANRKPQRASDLRRLGLTLFLFERPGGLDTLRQIARLPATEKTATAKTRLTARVLDHAEKTPLTGPQEVAFWEILYGPKPPEASQVPALRAQLATLHLGWFEDAAAADLYTRARMPGEAKKAREALQASALSVYLITGIQSFLIFAGFLGLIALGLVAWSRRNAASAPAMSPAVRTHPGFDLEGLPGIPPAVATPVPVSPPRPAPKFPFGYDARMAAFVAYLLLMTCIGLPFISVRKWIQNWPNDAQLRLGLILQVVLYLPVLWPALTVLLRRARRETGESTLTGREMLAQLGFRSDFLLRDIGYGLLGYLVTLPVFLTATVLSNRLFHRFHTPMNPAQLEIFALQSGWDRLLLLLTAAVAAPLVEETMFRGVLYPALRQRYGVAAGAALSAAVFALVHPTLPGGFLPIWVLGMAFALLYERQRSLVPSMVFHGLHNGLIMLSALAVLSS